jgi:hypothetical protein
MRAFLVAGIIALLTLPASAQGMWGGGGGGGGKRHHGHRSEDQTKKPKEDPQANKSVPDKTPAGNFDPWRNVRGSDPGKANKNPL